MTTLELIVAALDDAATNKRRVTITHPFFSIHTDGNGEELAYLSFFSLDVKPVHNKPTHMTATDSSYTVRRALSFECDSNEGKEDGMLMHIFVNEESISQYGHTDIVLSYTSTLNHASYRSVLATIKLGQMTIQIWN